MDGGLALIALIIFAIIAWALRLRDDAATARGQQRAHEAVTAYQTMFSHWLSLVTDRALEERLKSGIAGNDEALYEEVLRTQERYFDSQWCVKRTAMRFLSSKGKYPDFYKHHSLICPFPTDPWTALRILMANRGRLLYEDASSPGVSIWNINDDNLARCEARMKFVLCLDQMLRARGICEQMYVDNGPGTHYFKLTQDAIRSFGLNRVFWRPMIPTYQLEWDERRQAEEGTRRSY